MVVPFASISGKKTSSKTSGRSSTGPLSTARPGIDRQINKTESFYNTGGRQFFPGSTVPGASTDTNQGLDLLRQRALKGNKLLPAAQQSILQQIQNPSPTDITNPFYQQGIQGKNNPANPYDRFLNFESDPNAQRLLQSNQERLQAGLARRFSGGGRYGSQVHQGTLGRALGDSNAQTGLGLRNIALQAAAGKGAFDQQNASRRLQYASQFQGSQNQESSRLAQLAGLVPGLIDADFQDGRVLRDVGADVENRQRLKLLEDKERYDFNRDEPERRLLELNRQLAIFGGLGSESNYSQQTKSRSLEAKAGVGLEGLAPKGGGQTPATASNPYGPFKTGGAAQNTYDPRRTQPFNGYDRGGGGFLPSQRFQ